MDVHPTKNVSMGIDPYPYGGSMLKDFERLWLWSCSRSIRPPNILPQIPSCLVWHPLLSPQTVSQNTYKIIQIPLWFRVPEGLAISMKNQIKILERRRCCMKMIFFEKVAVWTAINSDTMPHFQPDAWRIPNGTEPTVGSSQNGSLTFQKTA